TGTTIVVRTTEHLPWNFGPRVQVVRTTLNLVRTTSVKTLVSPRSFLIKYTNVYSNRLFSVE
ncbi:hypothetical protein GIB67_040158, partial [Kingdonia uniflora]